jgi:hypothetical protein
VRIAPIALALAGAVATLAAAAPAAACPTCAVGDPTLTTMGVEQPLAGRVRAGLEVREVAMSLHGGDERLRMVDRRVDLTASWAPWAPVVLAIDVPIVHREVTDATGATIRTAGVGDTELGAKLHLWRDRPTFTRHHLALRLAVDLPTRAVAWRSTDAPLPHEAQPGTGSVDGRAGIVWGWLADPWSGWAQVALDVESENDGFQNGPRLTLSTALQHQPVPETALQLRADLRLDAPAEHHAQAEADTGGAILFVGPQILVAPWPTLLLGLSVRVPVVNAMRGAHDEGMIVAASVTVDL